MRCPFLNKECIGNKCMLWCKVQKSVISTGEIVPFETCSINMIPDMLVDIIKNTAFTQAAVEHRGNGEIQGLHKIASILDNARQNMIGASKDGNTKG